MRLIQPPTKQGNPMLKLIGKTLITAIAILNFSSNTKAQTPFTCSNVAYLLKGPNTNVELYNFNITTGTTGSLIYSSNALTNCLAYNPLDNMLYMVVTQLPVTTESRGSLIRVDAAGVATPLPVDNMALATGLNPVCGGVTPNGYYVMNYTAAGSNRYITIDINPARPTYLQIVDPTAGFAVAASPYYKTASANITVSDWAYNPADGLLYGLTTDSKIATLNIVTGIYTVSANSVIFYDGSVPGGAKGAAFIDGTGKLYIISNNEVSLSIDIAAGTGVRLSTGNADLNFDGASCPSAILAYDIRGNVFNDGNGVIDNTVNGTGTNAGGTIYATLYDNTTGAVIASVPVAADGSYAFGAAPGNSYSVYLGNVQAVVGQTATPATTLPPGYSNSSEQNCVNTAACLGYDPLTNGVILLGTLNGNLTQVNFGINRLPESDTIAATIPNPITNQLITLDGIAGNPPFLSGSDPEDQPSGGSLASNTVSITSLPTNGQLVYNGVVITVGVDGINPPSPSNPFVISNFNPSLLQFQATGIGYTTTTFSYSYVDAAGISDPTPATYTLNWSFPLPVKLTNLSAKAAGCKALINWKSEEEIGLSAYELQYSEDGNSFTTIETIKAVSSNRNYSAQAEQKSGIRYYRIKMIDLDGSAAYSKVMVVSVKCGASLLVYPNPVKDKIRIDGIENGDQVSVYNNTGQLIVRYVVKDANSAVSIAQQPAGIYNLTVIRSNKLVLSQKISKQ